MKSTLLFVLFLFTALALVGQFSAQQGTPTATPRPSPTPHPIPAVQRFLESFVFNSDFHLIRYRYERTDPDEPVGDCLSAKDEFPRDNYTFYTIEVTQRLPDGELLVALWRVRETFFRADLCKRTIIPPTPTPTPDLTRTTATPTFTPTLTFTPSQTPTASQTPTITPTFTATFTPTATQTLTPTVTPRATDAVRCEGFLVSQLQAGEQARALTSLRLRAEPYAVSAQLATVPQGARFDVVSGPECDDNGRAWWLVAYQRAVGWLIEGESEEYYTEPITGSRTTYTPPAPRVSATPRGTASANATPVTCAGFMQSRLIIGERGRVLPGDANNVRDVASADGALLGQIPGGGEFVVRDGPVCDSGRAWWLVDYGGLVGWTVEGSGSEYYLEPVAQE